MKQDKQKIPDWIVDFSEEYENDSVEKLIKDPIKQDYPDTIEGFIEQTRESIEEHEQQLKNKLDKNERETHKMLLNHQREQLTGFTELLDVEKEIRGGAHKKESRPSLIRRLLICIGYVFLALCAYVMWVDFMPSNVWLHWSFYLTLVGSVGAIGLMHWRTLEESDKNSSELFTISVVYVFIFLSFYGMWVDFIPSNAWEHWGAYLSMVGAVGFFGYLCWRYGTGRVERQKKESKIVELFGFMMTPFIVYGFFWLLWVKGLATIGTILVGTPHQEVTLLTKNYKYDREGCDYWLTGRVLEHEFFLPDSICISSSFYKNLPQGPVSIMLEGEKTVFGFHIQNIKRSESPQVFENLIPQSELKISPLLS